MVIYTLKLYIYPVQIIDPESGAAVGEGRKGELVVRGPQIMKGYLDDPQATADVIDAGGWLHTGEWWAGYI